MFWCQTITSSPGERQSPININTAESSRVNECGTPQLVISYNYSPNSPVKVSNNGYTVKFDPEDISESFTLHGGPVGNNVYVFCELHYHWGSNDAEGSEHTIDGTRYSAEAHWVFYKQEYGSKQEALNHPDGFVVFAVFLEGTNVDNEAFEPVSKIVTELQKSQDQLTMTAEQAYGWLMNRFPSIVKYFTYPGSISTPPFSENAQWIIFQHVVSISSQQIQSFRKLTNQTGEPIAQNFRVQQPLGSRTVCISRFYETHIRCSNHDERKCEEGMCTCAVGCSSTMS